MRKGLIAAAAAILVAACFGSATAGTPDPSATVTAGGVTFTVAGGATTKKINTLNATYILYCALGTQAWFQSGPAPYIGTIQGRAAISCTGGPVSRITLTACLKRDDSILDCIGGTEYGNANYSIPLAHRCSYTTYGYTWNTTATATVWNIFGSSGGAGNTSPTAYTHNCS